MTTMTFVLILVIIALSCFVVGLRYKNEEFFWRIKALEQKLWDAENLICRHEHFAKMAEQRLFALVSTLDDSESPFVRTFETRDVARQAGIRHLRTHHPQLCEGYVDDDDLWKNRNESFGADSWLFVCKLNSQMQPEPR